MRYLILIHAILISLGFCSDVEPATSFTIQTSETLSIAVIDVDSGKIVNPDKHQDKRKFTLTKSKNYDILLLPPLNEDGFDDVYERWRVTGHAAVAFNEMKIFGGQLNRIEINGIANDVGYIQLRKVIDGSLDKYVKVSGAVNNDTGVCLIGRLSAGVWVLAAYDLKDFRMEKPIAYYVLPLLTPGSPSKLEWSGLHSIPSGLSLSKFE